MEVRARMGGIVKFTNAARSDITNNIGVRGDQGGRTVRTAAVPAAARRHDVPLGKETNTLVPAKHRATSTIGKCGNPLRLETAAARDSGKRHLAARELVRPPGR